MEIDDDYGSDLVHAFPMECSLVEGKNLKSIRPLPDRNRRILAQAYDIVSGTTIYDYHDYPDCSEPDLNQLVDGSQSRPYVLLSWVVLNE